MKITCELIKDLLPLYTEGLCSEYTKSVVAAHVAECLACLALLNELEKETHDTTPNREIKKAIKPLKKIKKRNLLLTITVSLFCFMLAASMCGFFFLMEYPLSPAQVDIKHVNMLDEMTFSLTVSGKLLSNSSRGALKNIELLPSDHSGNVYVKAYGGYFASGQTSNDFLITFGFDKAALGAEGIEAIYLVGGDENEIEIIWKKE